jgi:hypothetical protein
MQKALEHWNKTQRACSLTTERRDHISRQSFHDVNAEIWLWMLKTQKSHFNANNKIFNVL